GGSVLTPSPRPRTPKAEVRRSEHEAVRLHREEGSRRRNRRRRVQVTEASRTRSLHHLTAAAGCCRAPSETRAPPCAGRPRPSRPPGAGERRAFPRASGAPAASAASPRIRRCAALPGVLPPGDLLVRTRRAARGGKAYAGTWTGGLRHGEHLQLRGPRHP